MYKLYDKGKLATFNGSQVFYKSTCILHIIFLSPSQAGNVLLSPSSREHREIFSAAGIHAEGKIVIKQRCFHVHLEKLLPVVNTEKS